MKQPKRILINEFCTDLIRGPVLQKIIWNDRGTDIEKIIFEGNSVLKFKNLQGILITPHEIYGYNDFPSDLPAGIYNLGHSKWFKSMSGQHLENFNHFKLFFYDEIIDVICKNIIIEK